MTILLGALASRLGLRLSGNSSVEVRGLAEPSEAASDRITYLAELPEEPLRGAGAILTGADASRWTDAGVSVLHSEDARASFRALLEFFDPWKPETAAALLSEVPSDVECGTGARIGRNVVLESGCRIGAGAVLMGNNFVGRGAQLGDGCVLHPGVVVEAGCRLGRRVTVHANSVIGSDGFGYDPTPRGSVKVRQIGIVEIGDDCEIGSNVSIDRATISVTRIGNRVKIDNLVQIAHNVTVGDDCILVAQVGIGGSSRLGRGVILAGQVGISDHVTIGDGTMMAAKSGLYSGKTIGPMEVLNGIPAIPAREFMRNLAYSRRLSELFRKKT